MRALVLLLGVAIAATGITPFDVMGIEIGADRVGELTLSIVVLIGLYFVLE